MGSDGQGVQKRSRWNGPDQIKPLLQWTYSGIACIIVVLRHLGRDLEEHAPDLSSRSDFRSLSVSRNLAIWPGHRASHLELNFRPPSG
jgi:hypothetical protein